MSTDTTFDRFGSMPLILRIACLASGALGLLQLVALIYPAVSPGIDGVALTSPILAAVMGIIHLAVALAIFRRVAWVIPIIIFLPFIQYGILYLEIGIPAQSSLNLNLLFSGIWTIFFCVYFFGFKAHRYFSASENT